jgi:hypothetical protein
MHASSKNIAGQNVIPDVPASGHDYYWQLAGYISQ